MNEERYSLNGTSDDGELLFVECGRPTGHGLDGGKTGVWDLLHYGILAVGDYEAVLSIYFSLLSLFFVLFQSVRYYSHSNGGKFNLK